MTNRTPKKPPKDVLDWESRLYRMAESNYIKTVPSKNHITKLAGLIAQYENPKELYWTLGGLFMDYQRKARWGKAVDVLCRNVDKLSRVVESVQAFDELSGRDIGNERFKLDQVVEVMVQIPKPRAYVNAVISDGLNQFSAVFHPNTLDYQKKELRGMFEYEAGSESEYFSEEDVVE